MAGGREPVTANVPQPRPAAKPLEDDSHGGSIPIQFERLGAGGLFCDVPKKGNWYMSTNG